MIVASLLLILVAVTLLVFGLAGGSSALLISSIVASLLAAVALVIGARQASAARRGVSPPGAGARPPRRRAPFSERETDPVGMPLAEARLDDRLDDRHGDPLPVEDERDRSAAYAAGRQDTEEYLRGPDATQRVHAEPDPYDAGRYDDSGLDDAHHDDAAAGRASSGQPAGPAASGSAASGSFSSGSGGSGSAGSGSAMADDAGYDRDAPTVGDTREGDSGEQVWLHESASSAPSEDVPAGRDDAVGEEFDEPDPDDPDDEPLPQAVRPADAVRVARLDAEVLVVDGRPRYHLADCPHLVGRSTEGLPVAEAVELGFSPCGLCRPVDRLVAAAARR